MRGTGIKHLGKFHTKKKGNKVLRQLSNALTEQTYWEFMDRFTMDFMSLFEYEGLPDYIDGNFIEETLFYYGNGVWFETDEYGLIFQPANLQGQNIWNKPTHFQVQKQNLLSYSGRLGGDKPDGIVMYNNPLGKPTVDILSLYAYRLTEVERTIDVNIATQKTPYIIETTKDNEFTLKNMMKQIDEFKTTIYAAKNVIPGQEGTIVHDLKSEYIADKLMEYKHDLENDIYTMLGVGNANTDKKERMITDEVNANNDQITISMMNYVEERQKALDKVNERFGTNIQVKFRLQEHREEEDQDGEIHSNTDRVQE